ncbi:Uncharacterised protein [Flavonifractor plautii]|nr:Uncharacterised protein [Flavonifractor plautii]
MATWNGVITNAGNRLLNEWVNEKTLNFDSAASGQGTVAEVAMMAQTALVNEKQVASLLGGEKVASGIRLKLRIAAPDTAYTLNQFRVSASVDGGSPAMLALFQLEQGIPIPSKTESPDFVYTFYALISCSNTGTWTVTVDTSACVTQGDMTAAITEAVRTKQDKLTGTPGQVVGFDEEGNAVPQAGGGVMTFNGRSGAVVPAEGDYTAEMVGARPESWIPSAADTGAVPITEKGAPNGVATLGPDGKVPAGQLPKMDYDPAGSAEAVQQALTAHTGNKNNPHAVTAEQVGASRAVKGTYPIAEGQSIQAGDVVDVVEGKAQKTLTPVANVETVLLERAVTHMALCDLNSEYAVVANSKDNGFNHAAFLISKKTGKKVGDNNYANETTITGLSIARLSDTQFLIGYVENRALYVKLGTVSGNSISFSQSESVDTAFYNLFALAELTNGRVAVVYSALIAGSNKLRMRVFTLSSSSLGSIYTRDITGESSGEISATSMNDGRVCICYVDLNDGNKGKVLIAAVDSSNAVTWGDVAVFNDTYTAKPRCASNQKGNVVISYYSSSPVGVAARTCIVSGNTIIPRFAPLQITSTSGVIENTIAQIPGACVVSCENGNAYLLLNEGSELSLAATYKFLHSSGTSKSLDITAIANKQVLLCYSAAGNSGYGTSTILTASGNQIAGSFINGSQDAIALKSGTAGQSIEVIYSGTVAADWVTEGQVISSPGVYGAGVLAGVLQVWGRGRPQNTKMATGVFVGRQPTTSDPINNIELGFKPQYIVALSEDNSVARYAALPGLSWRWNKNDVSNKDGITITDTGFYIPNNATNPNEKYHFVAFG